MCLYMTNLPHCNNFKFIIIPHAFIGLFIVQNKCWWVSGFYFRVGPKKTFCITKFSNVDLKNYESVSTLPLPHPRLLPLTLPQWPGTIVVLENCHSILIQHLVSVCALPRLTLKLLTKVSKRHTVLSQLSIKSHLFIKARIFNIER